MKRNLLLVVAWSVATLVAVGIAAAAVGSVRGEVTSVPAVPLRMPDTSAVSTTVSVADVSAAASTGSTQSATSHSADESQDTAGVGATDSEDHSGTTTTGGGVADGDRESDADDGGTTPSTLGEPPPHQPPSTSVTAAPSTSVTAAPVPTTAATTGASASPTRHTHDLVGGTVSVDVGDGTVSLGGASPQSGFVVRVENAGPQRVKVRFESPTHVSRFDGFFSNGAYTPKIEEHDRHGDDGHGGHDGGRDH